MKKYLLDDKAVHLANDYLRTEGALLAVLVEMLEARAFHALGYTSLFEYCVERLKLSHAQAFYFKSVAATPELHAPVMNGELSLSNARRIATVVTPETEESIKVLTHLLAQKNGKAATLAEVIAWATEIARAEHDPVRKAGRARKPISSGGEKPTSGRAPIPAPVRHAVMKRDDNRCAHVENGRRCTARRWLHLHHVREVAHGGANSVDNLATVCGAHPRPRCA